MPHPIKKMTKNDKYIFLIEFSFNSCLAIALSLDLFAGNLIRFLIKISSNCETVSLFALLA